MSYMSTLAIDEQNKVQTRYQMVMQIASLAPADVWALIKQNLQSYSNYQLEAILRQWKTNQ